MQFSKLIAAVALVASAAVDAFPTPISTGGGEAAIDKSIFARALDKDFKELLAEHVKEAIDIYPGIDSTKFDFHSRVGAERAEKVAKAQGRVTSEMIINWAILDEKNPKLQETKKKFKDTLVKYCLPSKEHFCGREGSLEDWLEAWRVISRTYAQYARVETNLRTTEKGPRKGAMFPTVEEPELKKNGVEINVDNKHPPPPGADPNEY